MSVSKTKNFSSKKEISKDAVIEKKEWRNPDGKKPEWKKPDGKGQDGKNYNDNKFNKRDEESTDKKSTFDQYLKLILDDYEIDQIKMILRKDYKIQDEGLLMSITTYLARKKDDLQNRSIAFLKKFNDKAANKMMSISLHDYLESNFTKYCDKHHLPQIERNILNKMIMANNQIIKRLSKASSDVGPAEFLRDTTKNDSNGFAVYLGVKNALEGEIDISVDKDDESVKLLNDLAKINKNSVFPLQSNVYQINEMYSHLSKYEDFSRNIGDSNKPVYKLLSEPSQCSFIHPLVFSLFFIKDKIIDKYFIETSISRAILSRARRVLDRRVDILAFNDASGKEIMNDQEYIRRLAFDNFNATVKNTNTGRFAFTVDVFNRSNIQLILLRNIYALRTGVYVEHLFDNVSSDLSAFGKFVSKYELPISSNDDYSICHLYKLLNIFALNTLSTVLFDFDQQIERPLSDDYSQIRALPLKVIEIVSIPVLNYKISDIIQYVHNQRKATNNQNFVFIFNQDTIDKIPDTFLNERNIITKYKKTQTLLHDFLIVYINRRTLSSVINAEGKSIAYQYSYGTYKHVDNRDSYYYFNDEFFGVDIMFQFGESKLFLKSFITSSFNPSNKINREAIESAYVLEYKKNENNSILGGSRVLDNYGRMVGGEDSFSDLYDVSSIYCYNPQNVKIRDFKLWSVVDEKRNNSTEKAIVSQDGFYSPIIRYSQDSFAAYMNNINKSYLRSEPQERVINVLLNSLPMINYHDTMITDYIDVLKRYYVKNETDNLPAQHFLDFYPTLLFKLMLNVIDIKGESNVNANNQSHPNPIICNFSSINRFYTLAKRSFLDIKKLDKCSTSTYCYDYFAHYDNDIHRSNDVYYKNIGSLPVNPHFLYPNLGTSNQSVNENSYDRRCMIDVLFSDDASAFRFHPIKLSSPVNYVHNNAYKFAYSLHDNLEDVHKSKEDGNWFGDMTKVVSCLKDANNNQQLTLEKVLPKGLGYINDFLCGTSKKLDFNHVYLNRLLTEDGSNYLSFAGYGTTPFFDSAFKQHLFHLSVHSAKVRASLYGEQSVLPYVSGYVVNGFKGPNKDDSIDVHNVLNMYACNKILTTMTLFENVLEPKDLAYMKLFTDVPIIGINENNYCKAIKPRLVDNSTIPSDFNAIKSLYGKSIYQPFENPNKFKGLIYGYNKKIDAPIVANTPVLATTVALNANVDGMGTIVNANNPPLGTIATDEIIQESKTIETSFLYDKFNILDERNSQQMMEFIRKDNLVKSQLNGRLALIKQGFIASINRGDIHGTVVLAFAKFVPTMNVVLGDMNPVNAATDQHKIKIRSIISTFNKLVERAKKHPLDPEYIPPYLYQGVAYATAGSILKFKDVGGEDFNKLADDAKDGTIDVARKWDDEAIDVPLAQVLRACLRQRIIDLLNEKSDVERLSYEELIFVLSNIINPAGHDTEANFNIHFNMSTFVSWLQHRYKKHQIQLNFKQNFSPNDQVREIPSENIYKLDDKSNSFIEYVDYFAANKLKPKRLPTKRLFNFRNVNDVILMSTFGDYIYSGNNQHPNQYICNLDIASVGALHKFKQFSPYVIDKLNELNSDQQRTFDNNAIECYHDYNNAKDDIEKFKYLMADQSIKLEHLCHANIEQVDVSFKYTDRNAHPLVNFINETSTMNVISQNLSPPIDSDKLMTIYKLREHLAFTHYTYTPYLFFKNYLKVREDKPFDSKNHLYKRTYVDNPNDLFDKFFNKKHLQVCKINGIHAKKSNVYFTDSDRLFYCHKGAEYKDGEYNLANVELGKKCDEIEGKATLTAKALYDAYDGKVAGENEAKMASVANLLKPTIFTLFNKTDAFGVESVASRDLIGLKSGVDFARQVASTMISCYARIINEDTPIATVNGLVDKIAAEMKDVNSHIYKNELKDKWGKFVYEVNGLTNSSYSFADAKQIDHADYSINPITGHIGIKLGWNKHTLSNVANSSWNGVDAFTDAKIVAIIGTLDSDNKQKIERDHIVDMMATEFKNVAVISDADRANLFILGELKSKNDQEQKYLADHYLPEMLKTVMNEREGEFYTYNKSTFYNKLKNIYNITNNVEGIDELNKKGLIGGADPYDDLHKQHKIGSSVHRRLYEVNQTEEVKEKSIREIEIKNVLEKVDIISPEGLLMAKLHHVYNSFAKTLNKHYFYNDSQDYDYEVLQTPDTVVIYDKDGNLDQVNCNFLYHTNILNVLKYYNLKEFEPDLLPEQGEMRSMYYKPSNKDLITGSMKYPNQIMGDKYERNMLSMNSNGETVDSLYALTNMTGLGYATIDSEATMQRLINKGLEGSYHNNPLTYIKTDYNISDMFRNISTQGTEMITYDVFRRLNNIFSLCTKNINKLRFDKNCMHDILESHFCVGDGSVYKNPNMNYSTELVVSFNGKNIYDGFDNMMKGKRVNIMKIGDREIKYKPDEEKSIKFPHYAIGKSVDIENILENKCKNGNAYQYVSHIGTKYNLFKPMDKDSKNTGAVRDRLSFNDKIAGVCTSYENIEEGHKLFKMPYYEKESLNPYNVYKFTSHKRNMRTYALDTSKISTSQFMNSFSSVVENMDPLKDENIRNTPDVKLKNVPAIQLGNLINKYYDQVVVNTNEVKRTVASKCVNAFRNKLKSVLTYLIKPNIHFKTEFSGIYNVNDRKDGEMLYQYMRRLVDETQSGDVYKTMRENCKSDVKLHEEDKYVSQSKNNSDIEIFDESKCDYLTKLNDNQKLKNVGINISKEPFQLKKLDLFMFSQLKRGDKYCESLYIPKFKKLVHIHNNCKLFKPTHFNVDEFTYSQDEIDNIYKSINTCSTTLEKIVENLFGKPNKKCIVKQDKLEDELTDDALLMNDIKNINTIEAKVEEIASNDEIKKFLPFHMYNYSEYEIVTSFDDALINYIKVTEEKKCTYLEFYRKNIALQNDAYFHLMPGVGLCKTSSILIYTTDSGCESSN